MRYVLGALITALFVFHATGINSFGLIDRLENFAYDTRLALTLPGGIDERIVIVDVDERSLNKEGRWPWNRAKLATIVDNLFDEYGIGILGFDMVFPEEDGSGPIRDLSNSALSAGDDAFVEQLDYYAKTIDADARFAESMQGRPVVLGYVFHDDDKAESKGMLPPPAIEKRRWQRQWVYPAGKSNYSANRPSLQNAAQNAGFFTNAALDDDGLWRRVSMLIEYEDDLYPALSLAVAATYLGERVAPGVIEDSGLLLSYPTMEWISLGSRRIPVDDRVAALIPYRGEEGSFPYVSAVDVLHKQIEDPALLKDAIVLVGARATGLSDHRPSPIGLGRLFPGVEIHANLVAAILDDEFKHRPAYTRGMEVSLLVLISLLIMYGVRRMLPLAATLYCGALLAIVIAGNIAFWSVFDLVVPVASSCMLIAILYSLNMAYGYFGEARARRELGGLFGQYVPPELVEEMSADPGHYSLAGDRREMTVMFSDVRGFTHISETLDPRELSQLLNEFLTWFTRIIHDHRGTIDKYMGDGVMAFWGAPIRDERHADRAVAASLQLIEELPALRRTFAERGWPELRIGIGLNSGVMNVGNMGSDFRMAYTVVGDAVNIGARLEDITKNYGVDILVGEHTQRLVNDIAFREVDRVRLRGRDRPVTVYEPLGPRNIIEAQRMDELTLYRQGLNYYRRKEWDLAELQFINLKQMFPHNGLYAAYLERIRQYRSTPPDANWDGTHVYDNT